MKRYLEKQEQKYVIATLDKETYYLKKTPAKPEYMFVTDVSMATKSVSYKIAEQIKNYYYYDTNSNLDLVIVPVMITYELIDETN